MQYFDKFVHNRFSSHLFLKLTNYAIFTVTRICYTIVFSFSVLGMSV